MKKRSNLPEILPILMEPYNQQRLQKSIIPSLRRLNYDDLQGYQPE